jgi:hypothetical protein
MGAAKHFYDAKDVQQLLGCGTIRTAQMRIKAMNDELKEKGYWTERGKVPVAFFHEKYPFIPRPEEINVAEAR